MEKLNERFNELRAECNQILDDCGKSFKEQKDNKIILTDKCGRKLAVIPFRKVLPYTHSFGIIYLLLGVTYMDGSLVAVCVNYSSHFACFSVDSLSWGTLFEMADMIVAYKHRGKREYDYEETKKFIARLRKKGGF